MATRLDVEEVCGVSQLCAGIGAGIEGAVHALNELFEEFSSDGWGVLMIDAKNAFNSLNRTAALWNIRVLWPRCSRFLFNSYRGWGSLVVRGSDKFMFSKEGVTQGDPLSMFMYAVGTIPLISLLKDGTGKRKQVWYADDASACSELNSLKDWFDEVKLRGPLFGYYPEPSKSYLVVHENFLSEAKSVFEGTGVNVVMSHRLLGGVIGSRSGKLSFIEERVKKWSKQVETLSQIAESQPQAAFAAFTKSLQFQWNFVQRVTPGCESLYGDLEDVILNKFLPVIMMGEVSHMERLLLSLPARWGGLGVPLPTEMSELSFSTSRKATGTIVDCIKGGSDFECESHVETLRQVKYDANRRRDRRDSQRTV